MGELMGKDKITSVVPNSNVSGDISYSFIKFIPPHDVGHYKLTDYSVESKLCILLKGGLCPEIGGVSPNFLGFCPEFSCLSPDYG